MRLRFWKFFSEYAAPVLAAIATVTMFCDVIEMKFFNFTGAELAFGCSKGGYHYLNFNIIVFLAYMCPLAGAIIAIISTVKNKPNLQFIAAGLMIVGAILMLIIPNIWCMFADGIEVKKYLASYSVKFLYSGIMGVVCAFLGGLSMLASCFIKLK